MRIIMLPFKAILGVLSLVLLIANFLFIAITALVLGFLVWLIPRRTQFSRTAQHYFGIVPWTWYTLNFAILQLTTAGKWHFNGDKQALSPKQWYLLLSNHQSWMDILVIGCLFRNCTPPLKFFIKKELLWQLPIAGLAGYFMGFPYMSRHSKAEIQRNPALKGKDIETTRKACKRFMDVPTTIINFVEGTRFTQKKHDQQNSPFKHLLKPKAGGIAIVVEELHKDLDGIIDVTIRYDADKPSFLNIILGNIRGIHVDFVKHDIPPEIVGDYFNDRAFRPAFQGWLNKIWEAKDQRLDTQS